MIRTLLKYSAGLGAGALAIGMVVFASAPAHATGTLEPCDIYANAGTPCVAANSTTRALFENYNGPLYTVQRDSDGKFLTINTTGPGGVADAAAQDSFCNGTKCYITDIADQTPYNNDLATAPAGGNGGPDGSADAGALPVTLDGGQEAYGVAIEPGIGYADDDTWMIPTGSQPQGAYMITGNANSGCCGDYGNAELNRDDNGNGHMFAANFGGANYVGVDIENGILSMSPPDNASFVTAFAKTNGTTNYVLEEGNADSGTLTTKSANLPTGWKPLSTEGGMVLGTGGDNSKTSSMNFYEGVMTAGKPTAAADAAVQANIVTAGYAYGGYLAGGKAVAPSFHNPYTPVTVNGSFSGTTVQAVQYVDGSATDGQFGPMSAGDMQHHLGRTVTHTLSSADVKALQSHVGLTGNEVDGIWGPITTSALQRALNNGTY